MTGDRVLQQGLAPRDRNPKGERSLQITVPRADRHPGQGLEPPQVPVQGDGEETYTDQVTNRRQAHGRG